MALLAVSLGFLGGCASGPAPLEDPESSSASTEVESELAGELQVFAAASLMGAFDALTELFANEHPNVEVAPPVYDGSSVLAVQIDEGAPANVFASADVANMEIVEKAGVTAYEPVVFASNEITIGVAPGNPKKIAGLEDLADPDIVLVLCQEEVPCGAASQQAFAAAGVKPKPVSREQNVVAVAAKVASGEADAGLLYVTDVQAADSSIEAVPIEGSEEFANLYPIAAVKNGEDLDVATAFIELVLSEAGQKTMEEFGFSPRIP